MATLGPGKDYSTLAAWEAVLDDGALIADAYGYVTGLMEDNSTVYFSGQDTTANYKIYLQADTGQFADGSDAKGAQIDVSLALTEATNICHWVFYGLEFHSASIGITNALGNASGSFTVIKCVFRDLTSHALYLSGCADVPCYIGVNLFRNIATASSYKYTINVNDADLSNVKIINNTIYDAWAGIAENAGVISKCLNNAVLCDNVNAAFYDYYSSPSNVTYCAGSGDTTVGAGTGCIDTLRDDGTDFTNTAGDDFTLVSNGVLTWAGLAVSGESWFPATDLAGNAWHNPPSMGCFEYVAAGGATLPIPRPLSRPFSGPFGGI